jgi:Bifunctional DNA primase/polymerase, N-terminal/Primase C terminal 1 (PriCT-1)
MTNHGSGQSSILRHALQLAAKGLAVFPCLPRSKKPATAHGFQDASKDQQQIEAWWGPRPDLNIGVATGAVSWIVVIDVDSGEKELRALEAQHGALPATVQSRTPRGGRHIFFRHPGWPVKCSQSEFAPGIDLRADGGYVVVPPSIWENGRRYFWSTTAEITVADAPAWVLDRLKATSAPTAGAPTPASAWRALVHDGVDEGQRNKSVARLAGHLLRRRIDPHVTLDLLIAWDQSRCRPPLGAAEVTTIVNSIAAKEIKRRSQSS